MIPMMSPPVATLSTDACVIAAAQQFSVGADLMLAIRSHERGRPGFANGNTDGSHDYNEPGLNTRTVIELISGGWIAQRLAYDGCYAMNASAYWMRARLLDQAGSHMPLLQRAARYHSKTLVYNIRYQEKIKQPMLDWACHLYHFWRIDAQGLFAVAANLVSERELQICQPRLNPY